MRFKKKIVFVFIYFNFYIKKIFQTVGNGSCSKLANLATTTSTKSVEIGVGGEVEAEAEVGIKVDPVVSTSMQSLHEISQHILKLCTAAQTTAVATTALTTSTVPSVTVTQDSSFLPMQVPVAGVNGCYTGQSSGTSQLISPQLQSLLALQFVTSQLPLVEPYRLPILTNPSNVASDIRWKPVYETQSSALSSVSVTDNNKSASDLRQHTVVTDGDLPSKGTPLSTNSDIPTCMTTSKTGIVSE